MSTLYHYDRDTGEYRGSSIARESPLEPGVLMVPANATTSAPPSPGPKQAAVWQGGAWSLVADHRGETWWLSHAASYVVQDLGTPAGSETQPAPPPPTAEELAAYAADKRWQIASGGITVPLPGGGLLPIPSDDIAYGRLKGAAEDLAKGIITEPITIVLGLTVLTASRQIAEALYAAISQHWQACYGAQGTVVDGINAGTITTFAQIDAAPWPSNG